MNFKSSLITAVFLSILSWGSPAQAAVPDFLERFHKMVQHAYANSGAAMKYASSKGAMLMPMADGNGLYLLWKPVAGEKYVKKMIVALPDEGMDAYRTFQFWHPIAEKSGHGLLIPQWRFVSLDPESDRATPNQIYATTVQPSMISLGVEPGKALLYGRAKNTALVYGMAAYDQGRWGRSFFGTVVVDDGASDLNEPIIQQINGGGLGRRVFDGSRWVVYCSTDCENMERVAAWILFQAGKIELFIAEPEKKGRALRDDPERFEKSISAFLR